MINKRKVKSIKKKKRTAIGRIVFRVTIVVFFAEIIYSLFFSGLLAVTSVNISGNDKIDQRAIRDIIDHEISGRYFRVWPKNNLVIAFFKTGKISKKITSSFKEIRGVKADTVFPDTLNIKVRERRLAMRICANGACFLVDEAGTAYKESPDDERDKWPVITLTVLGGDGLAMDKAVIAENEIKHLDRFRENLRDRLEIETGNIFETPSLVSSDMRVSVPEGFRILFSTEIPVEKEIETLKAVFDEKIKDQRGDLEYIDLRSDNKVFYKLKEQPQEESDPESSYQKENPKKENKNR